MVRHLLVVCAMLGIMAAPAKAADMVIGVPAWPSAQVTANIIAQSLKQKLNIDAELREGGTLTILTGLGRGTFQVHPEIWLPNLSDMVEKLSAADGTLRLAAHSVTATQNICTTKSSQEATGISSVEDLAKPEKAALFDSNGDGKGEIWIGAPTWSSTEIEKIRAHSYGYDKTMSLLEMQEDVGMASVDAAAAVGKPIVFYCYGPHHVFQLHDIVKLEEPAHNSASWTIVKRADDPEWLEKSEAASAWDTSKFMIGYAASLTQDMPDVAAFLDAIDLQPEDITHMSYAVQVLRRSPAQVAADWISDNSERVAGWVK